MTDQWHTADLDRFATADEVEITTVRPDGTQRRWVPIWIVRVGDNLYIRSYRGPGGAWYRHLTATGHGRLRIAGRNSTSAPSPPPTLRSPTTSTAPTPPSTAARAAVTSPR